MPDRMVLERLVSDVARQVRLRRAEYYGLRGLLWGAVATIPPLLFKELLGDTVLLLSGALLVAGAAAGALYGLVLKLPAQEAARLADRGYALKDRVATALEWADRPGRTPVVEALVADAVAH